MFRVEGDTLTVSLPEGKTQGEIIRSAIEEFPMIQDQVMGKNLLVTGRITTGLSLFLGHKLAHICKTVSIFDPKEGVFFKAIWH